MAETRRVLFANPAEAGRPRLGAIVDSGQMTALAVSARVDFLLALSAGEFRTQGVTTLSVHLPFQNGNDVAETLLRERILPASGETPVHVGILAGDPTCPTGERLDRLRKLGACGVINYPAVNLLDGNLRAIFEDQGVTVDAELELLANAQARGLAAIGFAGTEPTVVRRFAGSGLDALVLTPGPTLSLEDIHEHRDRLQLVIRRLGTALEIARREAPRLPCFVFGGPITQPEDLEQVMRQAAFDGFIGGSVFGRYPIEASVTTAFHRFRQALLPSEGDSRTGLGPMIGTTPAMRELYRLIRRSATCDLNVCVEGESGVGKELVATQIHRLSNRSHGTLVTLNCGAIADTLLESEFFGHERGAFTGAVHRRLGKFELAHNGTLFLDEVGDLSAHGQVALLRAIQQREITRVGGDASIPVDVRIVSASNQPLATLVTQGKFRADLYYRLNNLTLRVPPLRERLDDLPALIAPILAALRVQMGRDLVDLTPQFHDRLRRHAWPGNLRELQHVLAQASLLEDGPVLNGRHFAPLVATSTNVSPSARPLGEQIAFDQRQERRQKVVEALRESKGNKSRTAALLGISRKTLYGWIAELEVDEAP